MWRVTAVNRLANPPTEETLEFDALVLSDKLLVMPNVYAVLPPEELGPLSLLPSADPEAIHAAATADALPSQSAVVLLLALAVPLPEALQAAFGNSRAVFGDALREALGPQCDLALVVHDSAKPGRPGGGGGEGGGEGRVELFVVHSTERFAKVHLVADRGGGPVLDDPDAVRDHLCRQFYDAAGKLGAAASARSGPEVWPAPAYAAAVAWDHASVAPEHRLRGSHRVDGLRRVGLCGDFFGGFSESEGVGAVMGGVEAAALSGVALAGELAAVLIEKHAADRGAASRSAAI
ncbi:unnamed protein product [Polarella glacialis]|uniref:Amine oxidase domain-containing protein n=1 Tax=Polarella glacialis TaxID=89957 RepID=A0A813FSB0_POLGL|nr:unnamed protein product [Polarella glacialis]CAE8722229.1 unnamed protein product [Polarella glacialis]